MQQLTELVPKRGDRGREGLRGWISYIFPRELWQEDKRKGGCELISQYIVSCHFYSTPKKPITASQTHPPSPEQNTHDETIKLLEPPQSNKTNSLLHMIRLMFKPTSKSVCVSLRHGHLSVLALWPFQPPTKQTNKRNPPLVYHDGVCLN